MPRQPRLIVPGVALHVVQRGNNRMRCFGDESDCRVYYALLGNLSARTQCAVHAYCLMPNHIHILLTPDCPAACAGMMKALSQAYARYFNDKYGRTGTLWEGRFRSCIAESARYVLACYRYIELNPVRAGMVRHPAQYPWSSYAWNSGGTHDGFLVEHAEYSALASSHTERRAAYRVLLEETVESELLDSIRAATSGGYPLGSDSFKSILPPGRKLDRGRPGRKAPEQAPRSESVPAPDLFAAT